VKEPLLRGRSRSQTGFPYRSFCVPEGCVVAGDIRRQANAPELIRASFGNIQFPANTSPLKRCSSIVGQHGLRCGQREVAWRLMRPFGDIHGDGYMCCGVVLKHGQERTKGRACFHASLHRAPRSVPPVQFSGCQKVRGPSSVWGGEPDSPKPWPGPQPQNTRLPDRSKEV